MAISQTRPRVVPATMPIAFWRLPAASSCFMRRWASIWIPRCSEPDGGGDGETEQRQIAEQENGERDEQRE